jgi:adenylate cyclase
MWSYIVWPTAQYDSLERSFYDTLVRLSLPPAHESRLVIVDIDERSLERLGSWPWSRATMANLVNELTERQKVALLGLDIVFPQNKSGDVELRKALDRSNVVMSQALDFSPQSANRVGQPLGGVKLDGRELAPMATGYIANDPGLLARHAGMGHISPIVDDDGHVRRLYPIACVDANCVYTLALRMYLELAATEDKSLRAAYAKRGKHLLVDIGSNESIDLPLDKQRALMVPYRVSTGGFQVISAIDVMEADHVLPELENTIVLVGSSALGIGDRVATPLNKLAPGVEVHAQLLVALLDGRLIQPVSANSISFLLLAAVVVISWIFWPRGNRYVALLWPALILIFLIMVLSWFFLHEDQLLPLSPLPLLVIVIATSSLLAENFSLDGRMRNVTSHLGQFLPSVLVGRLLKGGNLAPETALYTMTVMIADIRGFTAASEGKTPEQIAEFAQKCFEVLSAEVSRYQGTIERYSGDGLVAMWGEPSADDAPKSLTGILKIQPVTGAASLGSDFAHAPHAAKAVSAAIAMQQAIENMSDWFTEKHYGPRQLSIGLNTGPMAVGVFGGQTHLTWSAQGQAFNITSRIETLTRELDENILMGETTAKLLMADSVRRIGSYAVKGVTDLVVVYAPVAISANKLPN